MAEVRYEPPLVTRSLTPYDPGFRSRMRLPENIALPPRITLTGFSRADAFEAAVKAKAPASRAP